MAETDYYKILGLNKNATDDQIKKAYRKLAMKYHPDHSKGNKSFEEQFKKISEAYAVLSDKEKRKQYDMFGSTGFKQRYSQEEIFRNFDVGDILKEFGFGGGNFFSNKSKRGSSFSFNMGDFFGSGVKNQNKSIKGSDLEYELPLTIKEIATGTNKTLSISRGSTTEKITVKIPKGMISGKKLRLAGKGEQSPYGAQPGDLYIKSKILNDPIYGIENYDLFINHEIKLTDSILGTNITIPSIDGKDLSLKIPSGTKHQTKLRLPGHGIPHMNKSERGDLFVRILVKIPQNLTKSQTKLIQKLADAGL